MQGEAKLAPDCEQEGFLYHESQCVLSALLMAHNGVAQETYGAMAKTEKIAFILEQVRLCLDRGDYVR